MRISDLVKQENVYVDLEAGSREVVLREMVERLEKTGALGKASTDDVVQKLIEREMQGSTGFGAGVALPHVKMNDLAETVISVGRCEDGIDFNATDGEPVHTIFLILSPESDAETHLAALKWIVTLAQSRYYARLLRGSRTVTQIAELMKEFDDEAAETA
jgi:mannitol/fructose-specific phosphotransferase system IIA component (Ntr-type)